MKPKKFWSTDVLLVVLAISCVVLAVLLCVADPTYLPAALGLLAFLFLLAAFDVRMLRHWLRRLFNAKGTLASAANSGFAGVGVSVAAVNGGKIVWYNNAFKAAFGCGEDIPLASLKSVIPELDLKKCETPGGYDVDFGGRRYTAWASSMKANPAMYVLMLADETQLKLQAEEYLASRPCVMYIVVDTYDDILRQMKESERTAVLADIHSALERYVDGTNGFLCRISSSRYVLLVEERYVQQMTSKRFEILDIVRKIDPANSLSTLSIGVGRSAESFAEAEVMAQQALDMALGRGGDQVAIKSPDGFEFFGGVSRSVEKRTRVKSRMMANSIAGLMEQAKQVLVMGHRDSDMDSVGSSVGMARFAALCGRPAAVVVNRKETLAGSLVEHLCENGDTRFVTPAEAMKLAKSDTLVIVTDTHMPTLLESPEVFNACGTAVVIDHHRKMVGHIDTAVVFYHEPYASSASELVSELLQHLTDQKQERVPAAEAEALLAGIMLDTRTFSLHVGVRTFEAAAYLRRMGAQTGEVKKLFASSLNDYINRARLVGEAEIHDGCALVLSEEIPEDAEVVTAQAANDLLTIEGVQASFVAVDQGKEIRISARSMGEVNVQLVMEKLGGGGHLTMAGAQIKGATLDIVRQRLINAISEYKKEASVSQANE